jgi:hypothetical protein
MLTPNSGLRIRGSTKPNLMKRSRSAFFAFATLTITALCAAAAASTQASQHDRYVVTVYQLSELGPYADVFERHSHKLLCHLHSPRWNFIPGNSHKALWLARTALDFASRDGCLQGPGIVGVVGEGRWVNGVYLIDAIRTTSR